MERKAPLTYLRHDGPITVFPIRTFHASLGVHSACAIQVDSVLPTYTKVTCASLPLQADESVDLS